MVFRLIYGRLGKVGSVGREGGFGWEARGLRHGGISADCLLRPALPDYEGHGKFRAPLFRLVRCKRRIWAEVMGEWLLGQSKTD